MAQRTIFVGILLSLFVVGGCSLFHERESSVNSVSVPQVARLLESDTTVFLLDVRTPEEWKSETGHLKGALLIPLQDLETQISDLAPYKKKSIIVYCRTGKRSQRAAKILADKGYRALSMEGGILKWNAEGFPVVKEGDQ
jgi:phage shock protein E